MIKYIKPEDVVSPMDYVKDVCVVHDGGSSPDDPEKEPFSVAWIKWGEDGEYCLAVRWNVSMKEFGDPEKREGQKTCVGMPSSHGVPVWFILPDGIVNPKSDVWTKIKEHKKQKKK